MATSLLKLIMTASEPTTVAHPSVANYFNTAPTGGYTGAATYTINANQWKDDAGNQIAVGGLVPVTDGYYQLYINGQLQEGDVITTVTTTAVAITFGATTVIDEGKILALVAIEFAPTTTAPVITG